MGGAGRGPPKSGESPMIPDEHRRQGAGKVARCGICTVSDTRTFETDRGGTLIRNRLVEHSHEIVTYDIVRDDPEEIRNRMHAALQKELDIFIFSGGTGISPRDRTPEVAASFFERELQGFGELFRMLSYEEIGAAAFLSRATAGIVGQTAIFCLPGSPAAVRLALDKLLLPELPHLLAQLER